MAAAAQLGISPKSAAEPVRRIGIFGHVGNTNLGDECIIAAVAQNVRRRFPGAEVVVFCINPEDTKQRHGLQAFPIRPGHSKGSRADDPPAQSAEQKHNTDGGIKGILRKFPALFRTLKAGRDIIQTLPALLREIKFSVDSISNLRGTDLLIVAGSGQLCDHFGGPFGFPYTLLRWTVMARFLGTKVAFASVGAGPIHSKLSRFFIRRALALANYRSYRDETSKKLIESIGVSGSNHVCPDLAYSLELSLSHPPRPAAAKPLVGINAIPFFDYRYWHKSDEKIYAEYVNKIADFASWLLDSGYAVQLFPTQLHGDTRVIADIEAQMSENARTAVAEARIATVEDLLAEIARADYVVAARFHGVLLPLLLQKPVLGLAYQEKTVDLMAVVGQKAYALSIANFDVDLLMERFGALTANRQRIRSELAEKVAANRAALERQYNEIFNLLGERASLAKAVWS